MGGEAPTFTAETLDRESVEIRVVDPSGDEIGRVLVTRALDPETEEWNLVVYSDDFPGKVEIP